MSIRLELPIHILSESNRRDHWAVKARRVKQQRMRAWAEILDAKAHLSKRDSLRISGTTITIRLTRIAPKLLDDDNLCSGFKGFRDGIAQAWGLNDNSGLVQWEYSQEHGTPRQYAVRIEIEEYIPCYERDGYASNYTKPVAKSD